MRPNGGVQEVLIDPKSLFIHISMMQLPGLSPNLRAKVHHIHPTSDLSLCAVRSPSCAFIPPFNCDEPRNLVSRPPVKMLIAVDMFLIFMAPLNQTQCLSNALKSPHAMLQEIRNSFCNPPSPNNIHNEAAKDA